MTQELIADFLKGIFKGKGIVAVLFIMGVVLIVTQINNFLGTIATIFAVLLAIGLGLLGLVSVAKRVLK